MARQTDSTGRSRRKHPAKRQASMAAALGRPAAKAVAFLIVATLYILYGLSLGHAASLDYYGPPPPGDPSEYRDPVVSDNAVLGAPANEGSLLLEGGVQGTIADVGANNVVPAPGQNNGNYNIPTNSKPSPLFGAQPYTQQMLLFEEFGPEPLDTNWAVNPPPGTTSFPAPPNAHGGPDPVSLENFLAEPGIVPYPSEYSNVLDQNPWKPVIGPFIGRPLDNTWTPPAEGRPPGLAWSHQRFFEFYPESYYKTAQAGARTNGGFRDSKQRHGYAVGEFGPGGLYHQVYHADVPGGPTLNGTTNGISIRFHPLMPIQDPLALWTFDGTLPPKLLMARYGQPILMRHYNALPIDPSANRGFGLHTITTHEHNGHNPSESDGYANAFFFPGQYYDYRWPMQLAGYDTINTTATDPRAAFPCDPGETLFVNDSADNTITRRSCTNGSIKIRGDWHETMSTHWFHDHMLDFTAQNVYKGNAVMMNYYSAIDRGNEGFVDNVNLRFPSGTALPWGNRDYDVNLLVADKAWDSTGQLWFNIFNTDGFIGDQVLVNWLWRPYFDVRARRYRFRILNGSVSRYLALALVKEVNGTGGEMPGPAGSNKSYNRVPFYMIANDGNILEHAVPFDGSMSLYNGNPPINYKGQLPTQGIAERYDIVVDFSSNNPAGIQPGDKLYLVNRLEHRDGHVVRGIIPLANILSGAYQPVATDTTGDGVPDEWINGDPGVGKIMELRVQSYSGTDLSMDPREYLPPNVNTPAGKTMIPLWAHFDNAADLAKLAQMRHRTFTFARGGTDESPWTIKTDDGLLPLPVLGYNMDPRRISASPQMSTGPTQAGYTGDGTTEVWTIDGGGGWDHPVHVHFEEGIVLSRGGKAPPEWEKWARKDLYRIGPDEDSTLPVVIAIHFREFAGTYVEHCHNTQHEDHAMLLRWDIEHPGQFQTMATPLPTWDGVEYAPSAALPTWRTIQMSANIANPKVGDNVTCSATTWGLTGAYEYQFLHRPKGGAWEIGQPWGTATSYLWHTDGLAPAEHEMLVNIRPAGATEVMASATMPMTLASAGVSAVTLTPSPASPVSAGTAVTFTGGASGGTGSYEYQFLGRAAGSPTWSVAQSWSPVPFWTWGSVAGNWEVQVNARTAGSAGGAEASQTILFTANAPAATAVTLAASPASPAAPGTSITFSASASGGSGSYEYEFRGRAAGSATWSVAQAFGPTPSWTWTGVAGNWEVQVNARSAGSSSPAEATQTIAYSVGSAAGPVTGVTITASPASPQTAGPTVTFTGAATGGSGTYEYEFQGRLAGGVWGVARSFDPDPNWAWSTAGVPAGTYEVKVNARNVGSSAAFEATATTSFIVQ